MSLRTFKLGGKDVLIARTPMQRMRGLMFKRPRPILFIFPYESYWIFHTSFCLGNIDIIFLNNKKQVVSKFLDVRPFKTLIKPSAPSKYVLEAPAGEGTTLAHLFSVKDIKLHI